MSPPGRPKGEYRSAQHEGLPVSEKHLHGTAPKPAMKEWPLWEVFVRSKQGLDHKHCGSLHASDARQALIMARDVYTRRQEGVSIWVVPSVAITASNPDDKGELFDPAADKIYRHPTFYDIPDEVGHM